MNKIWLKAALVRALRAFAQGALGAIGSAAMFSDVRWHTVLCTAALAAVVSLLMSLAGLPEVTVLARRGDGSRTFMIGAPISPGCAAKTGDINPTAVDARPDGTLEMRPDAAGESALDIAIETTAETKGESNNGETL